ncbi:MAG: magnesium transporter [Acidimicrobiia bacterium]|nr:magnesium transporter [Acidimicrobiia bacterium]
MRDAGEGAPLVHDQDVLSRAYQQGRLVEEDFALDRAPDLLAQQGTVLWLDLYRPSHEELAALGERLGLHELAVEDAAEPHQRPKVDHYDTHLFVACPAVGLDGRTGDLETTEVDVFLGRGYLVTVRKGDGFPVEDLLKAWDRSPELTARGPAYLLYGLLDTLVDGYYDVVQVFEDFYDEVSEAIFTERPIELSKQQHWFQMRRALARFHRLAAQVREAVSSLLRREHATIDTTLYPYYQDVYDHVLRVTESTDALRDLVGTIVDTNVALRDILLNQVMKKLTGWAAIVAVPTLVTGFYGMNVPFPGHGQEWGVAVAILLIVVLSGGLYVAFKKKDWL